VRDRETDNLWIQNLEGSPGKQLTDFKKSEGARRGKGRAWREAHDHRTLSRPTPLPFCGC
jgi:hypothetical protein